MTRNTRIPLLSGGLVARGDATARLCRIRLPIALLLALQCAALSDVRAQPPAEDCAVLFGTGKAQASSPDAATGTAKFLLNGVRHTATLDLTFTFGPPAADGTSNVVSTHHYKVRDKRGRNIGTFQTNDTGALKPGNLDGILNLDSNMTLVSGTGRFRRATGAIADRGFLNVAGAAPASVSALAGRICFWQH